MSEVWDIRCQYLTYIEIWNFLRVCLRYATLHMLKQLIIVTFSWKTTIMNSEVLYLILNVQISIQISI